ncbi:MAG: pyruvate carboxylase [Saprospiraceae bacterium]|nr:pyruvate carboxylase [Saprospiraceae bacterium]
MSVTIQQFDKIMVANRGEIAIRVLRAASELQIRTVAIYTYEDRYSLHRFKADESYQIGENNDPLKPYLDIEEILRVAKKQGVQAIHPGYGFLSENVRFAQRCREEGVVFIGPSPETMARVGDKVAAKTLGRELDIPLIEDSRVPLINAEVALSEAKRIGFPVMVKAASGGGGRGMRVVWNEDELKTEFNEAKGEALTAFGDDTVFLEKYVRNPKHIEVQLMGDKHGNLIHLFERDCSVQRRFQKVVEIAPCLTLSQATKQKIYDYAIKLGKAVNYSCAGTVEFLVDEAEDIYFIEVNPRIQVEHTITEEITGVDIVRTQILVCMGYEFGDERIRLKNQADIVATGCAIQCRVTTEDPANGFKPDFGTLIAYRSASGMGIRLDAGSAYPGAQISPFFDSLLVKVTAWGRTMNGASQRLHRALREFRVRGVKTNIDFLLNLLQNETFVSGNARVGFIPDNPDLFKLPHRQDRGTKMLRYLANVIVNGNPDVKFIDKRRHEYWRQPVVPPPMATPKKTGGYRKILLEQGPEALASHVRQEKRVLFTDTTFRDAHQSLLATRMRTYDMMQVAQRFNEAHGAELFSMEVWGGATFDVALRFLKESPWVRLKLLREALPDVCLQMLLRGSNAVGYTAYPDNLVVKFVEEAAESGIDIFRIFDSLNWVKAMETSIRAVRERTGAVAEACICYTGDITDPSRTKFDLPYYVDLAKRLEDAGAHFLAIKDMAGLLKPQAATDLIGALQDAIKLPIHLHTHDTSSVQSATYLKAVEAGVDVIDLALASMSGLTSQPNLNSVLAMLGGNPRQPEMNQHSLNAFSNYWEAVREYYYPFETELRAGTAEVYENEIPGGQYSNLRPQARGLGLEDQFETIKSNYIDANLLLGDLIKVTPSSKVVGDLAMFMTANKLSSADVLEKGNSLAFPDSVKSLMRGDLGQIDGGFPPEIQRMILKGEEPYTERPNEHMDPVDFDTEFPAFLKEFGAFYQFKDFLSYKFYPQVFRDFHDHFQKNGVVGNLPSPAFFFGMEPNEEILVELEAGKTITIKFINKSEPNDQGHRLVFFKLNGQTRAMEVRDENLKIEIIQNRKAKEANEIGAPLQGKLSKILVEEGDVVKLNSPLFVIEAMKMESTITSPGAGTVRKIHLNANSLVEQDDLVVELE